MSTTAARQVRFHFVDGFRGIAATMIVLHHSVSSNVAKFLWKHGLYFWGDFFWNLTGSAVDLFFVISGLVLLRPYLRGQRQFNAATYFKKRFTRIYPTYLAAVIFGAAVIWYINKFPTWYNIKGIHMSFSWAETIREALIFKLNGNYYNLTWWSIGVEAMFYLLVPLVVLMKPDMAKLTVSRTWLVIAITIGVTFLMQFGFDRFWPRFYDLERVVLNIGRFVDYPLCFTMGVLIAGRDYDRSMAWPLMIVGSILFLLHFYYLPIMHAGYGLFYAGLMILSFNSRRIQQFLGSTFFLWVGERSYSLFLVHLSVFYLMDNLAAHFVSQRGMGYALITRGLGIPIAFLVSLVLFNLVEKRFARGLITDRMRHPWDLARMRKD